MPVLISFLRKRYIQAIICLAVALAGIFYGISAESRNEILQPSTFRGYIVGESDKLYFFKTLDGEKIKVYSKEKLEKGVIYSIECKIQPSNKNPYTIKSSQKFCIATKTTAHEKVSYGFFELLRENINSKLKESLDKETAAVMIAMTTGEKSQISKQLKEVFQKTGLIHLLTISGAHFSFLFTVCFIFFRQINKLLPYKWLVYLTFYIKPSQLSIILCFPLMLFYFLLIEPSYPSTRAFIMATLFMIGVLTERKTLWILTLSWACLIILIIEPNAWQEISFQLSFLASIAIGFASDIYKTLKEKIKNKALSYVALSFLISLFASLATAPIVIYYFHYFSTISPLSNLTAGILIGMVLFPLNINFVAIYLITGYYPLAELVNTVSKISFSLMHALSSIPFSSITIPPIPLASVIIFYIGFGLILFIYYSFKSSKKLILCLSIFILAITSFLSFILINQDKNSLQITFLDVGQADSAVVETPYGAFLIDTGKTGFEAQSFLKAKGYSDLQALIITHEQKDHAGGFLKILENFNVKEIWDNGYIQYNIANIPAQRHLERGDVLKIGSCTFTVLHPYKDFYVSKLSKDSNELSLIFKLQCFKNSYLFTSDAGVYALESIPLKYAVSDVVKIPHHGSKNSLNKEFYKAIFKDKKPICIISVGKSNPYHHPHKEVIDFISKDCTIYRTDIDGAIQIVESADGKLKLKTYEQTMFKPYEEVENLKKLFILW
ncbi:DNA internalization-related competence protein ComEC/Rec2 [Thermodesulfovibrio hydrogeniphilus]